MKRITVLLAILAAASSCAPTPKPRHTLTCLFAERVELIPIVNLEIRKDGQAFWNGVSIDRKYLGPYFAEVGQVDPQPQIHVFTKDPSTPYSTVATILQLTQQNKAYGVSVGTSRYPHLWKGAPGEPPDVAQQNIPVTLGCWTKPFDAAQFAVYDDIEIASDSRVLWNGEPLNRQELQRRLTNTIGKQPQHLIRLKIAPEAPAQMVGDIMVEIQRSGAERMQFETE